MTQKCSQTAPVNPLSPANGIVGALAPRRLVDDATEGKLVDGAHGRPNSKAVAHLRDAGSHAVAGEDLLATPAQPGSVLLQALLDCAIIA